MKFKILSLILLLATLATSSVQGQGIVEIQSREQPERRFNALTIEKHHVEVTIEDGAVVTRVLQVFGNPNNAQLEGSYIFPIPDAASITEFTMVMGGKTVKGEVLERNQARAIYEGIVRQMRDPALLEYMGRDLFRARVFPIPAKASVEVTLTYVEELKSDGGVFEYRYPLKTQGFSKTVVDSLALTATLKSSREIKTAFSSSHKVALSRRSASEVSLSFEGKRELADRDFHLFFTESAKGLGLNLLTDTTPREGGFFMMKIAPPLDYDPKDRAPKDIVFVLDTSGSMQEDDKIAQARQALIHGLSSLADGDRFQIVTFSTDARPYAKTLVEVDRASIAQAIAWVKDIEAAGGTNIDEGLKVAAESLKADERMSMVVFLTDGRPTIGVTDEKKILEHAGTGLPKKARLFVFGVGYDVNARLLDTLAEQGRGARDYVTPGQNLELELSQFFDKVSHPVLSNLELLVEGIELFEVYPKNLPDLFKGSEITILGRYRGQGHQVIRLKGQVGDSEKEFIFEGNFKAEKTGRDFIPVLWAKRKVGFLYDEIRLKGENKELVEEIVRLGKTFGIATPYTSYLVTEDGEVPEATGRLRDNRRDRGWDRPTPGSPPAGSGAPAVGGRIMGGLAGAEDAAEADDQSKTPSVPFGKRAVTASLEAKKMKDSEELSAEDRRGSKASKRIQGRSFKLSDGVWFELNAEGQMLKAEGEVPVEAYSELYFKLVKTCPELGEILAELESCVLSIDGKVYRFKAEQKAEAPAPR